MSAEQFSLLPSSSAGPGRVSGSERAPVGVDALAGDPGPVGPLGLPERLPGETWRGKGWRMFRAPDGRAVSILVATIEFGRHVGRDVRLVCPALGISTQFSGVGFRPSICGSVWMSGIMRPSGWAAAWMS